MERRGNGKGKDGAGPSLTNRPAKRWLGMMFALLSPNSWFEVLHALQLRVRNSTNPSDAPWLALAGAAHIYLAGRLGQGEMKYREAGVKDFICVGGNVLTLLNAAHGILDVGANT
jgi:hypothetical protein